MLRSLLTEAVRGISHPNTDLDAQTFLLRIGQIRAEAGASSLPAVDYRPQVEVPEHADPRVLIWDIGRLHDPDRGNFDHHQDHRLGATPILLCEALGTSPKPLDSYVDLADRGHFFKSPQPYPFAETLQGVAAGINLLVGDDRGRSCHYLDLLDWIERAAVDPAGHLNESVLPIRFQHFQSARREEDAIAQREAAAARWHSTAVGKVAFISCGMIGVMRALYELGAALVVLYEPRARISGWRRHAKKYTIGANPAIVAIPDQLDLRPLFSQLSALEPTGRSWGGQAGIGGSPREEGGSHMAPHEVMRVVLSYLG